MSPVPSGALPGIATNWTSAWRLAAASVTRYPFATFTWLRTSPSSLCPSGDVRGGLALEAGDVGVVLAGVEVLMDVDVVLLTGR